MEVWDDIALHIAKPYCKFVNSNEFNEPAMTGVKNLLNIYFQFDMKIRELNQWLSDSFVKILSEGET